MSEIKTITIKTKFDDSGVKNLNNELTEVNENQKNINESTTKLTGTLDKLTGGAITKFKNFKSGLGGVATGFKSVGAAIAASGIGLPDKSGRNTVARGLSGSFPGPGRGRARGVCPSRFERDGRRFADARRVDPGSSPWSRVKRRGAARGKAVWGLHLA